MIHPATELRFIDAGIGHGVFATRDIPRGTITWTADALDQRFTSEQVGAMTTPYREILARYSYVARDGVHILCWDIARFVNHSCEPNCLAPGYDLEVAIRDIAAGEQLTDDYGSLNVEVHFECRCGSPRCRRLIGPDDLSRHADAWDALVAPAFARIRAVAQPLWPFLADKAEVERVLDNGGRPASCRLNSHPPPDASSPRA